MRRKATGDRRQATGKAWGFLWPVAYGLSPWILLLGASCAHQAPTTPPPAPVVVPVPPPPPPPPPDPIAERRALAKLGISQLAAKQYDDAFATLGRAADADPVIAPFLRLRLIEVEAARGNFANAASIAAQIIATAPDTSAATIARLRLPGLYARAGDAASADAAFKAAMTTPLDELSESEFVDLAKALDAAARPDLASAIRMRLLTEFPQGRFTEDTYDRLKAMAASPLDALSFDDILAIAQRLGQNDRYDREFDLMARIAARFPNAPQNDAFRAIRIRALFNSRHYTELLDETKGVKLDAPLSLFRARAAWRLGKADEFLAGLNAVEKQWPSSPQAIETKILHAKYYSTDEVKYDVAIENLKAVVDAGAIGNEGENLWALAFTYILAKRDDDALRTLGDYLRQFADADYTSNALFWSGKLLDKAGRKDERDSQWAQLIAKYPYGYFSYRARELSGAPATSPVHAGEGAGAPQKQVFPDLSVNEPGIDAVRELAAVGLMRDASREMKRIAAAHPDNLGIQFMLADIYVQGGEPFKANGILQRRFREFVRHGGANIPQRFWQILFPLNYWPAIQREAARRGIDPYLVASIIRQETGFEPTTVSNAGAIGLMQIMPAEGQAIATRGGIGEPVTRETLFDPDVNIAVGAAELSQKLQDLHGEPILAIAAYNAGTDAVGRWLAQTPVDDVDLFVEAIPYAETRLYVKTVTRNRFEYRRIYESSSSTEVVVAH
jgi:peptidoglycan lytic transglycosylase